MVRRRYRIVCGVFALAVISGLLLNYFLGFRPDAMNTIGNSDVIARPSSASEQHGWLIASSIALFLQELLILLLLFERQRRTAVQQDASQSLSEALMINRPLPPDEVSAFIAHELKQPLSAILTNTEAAEVILKSATPSINELQDIVADIKRDEMRAAAIIDLVRNIFRPLPSPARPIDLNCCIRDIFQLVSSRASANGIVLKAELDENLPELPADPIQIQQVILNITVNAIDAIVGHHSTRREIVARTSVRGHNIVEITIINYGPRIPPQLLKKIFDAYYTTKAQGTGLGLAISRKIILAHHGRIWASNGNEGAVMLQIHLPIMNR